MNLVVLLGAIVVAVLVFGLLVKIARATIGTAITIAIVILVLQLLFGIAPAQLWQPVSQFFQPLWQLVSGGR